MSKSTKDSFNERYALVKAKLVETFANSSNQERLLDPEEILATPFFKMTTLLRIILESNPEAGVGVNERLIQNYQICLRGINPFKASALKKAGVDQSSWKAILAKVSKEGMK